MILRSTARNIASTKLISYNASWINRQLSSSAIPQSMIENSGSKIVCHFTEQLAGCQIRSKNRSTARALFRIYHMAKHCNLDGTCFTVYCDPRKRKDALDVFAAAGIQVQEYPHVQQKDKVEMLVCRQYPPPGCFEEFPNLKVVQSYWAGVDKLLDQQTFPKHVTLCRMVIPSLTINMVTYVTWAVLNHIRNMDPYFHQQLQRTFQSLEYPANTQPRDIHVAILGYGVMGGAVGRALAQLGFNIIGWKRGSKQTSASNSQLVQERVNGQQHVGWTEHQQGSVKIENGQDKLYDVVGRAQIVVNTLPTTHETRGMINKNVFDKMQRGCYFINVGRAATVVEQDLIAALKSKQLGGACLDVFDVEPLPEESELWNMEGVRVTPHVAANTDLASATEIVIQNFERMVRGEELLNVVDMGRGY